MSGADMTAAEAARLEAALVEAPDDLAARARLVWYYAMHEPGAVAAEREIAHVTWLISNHPQSEVHAEVVPSPSTAVTEAARRCWLAAVEAHPSDPRVLEHASDYLVLDNEDLAEALMRRGAALEPTVARWHASLAHSLTLRARHAPAATARSLWRDAMAELEQALTLEAARVAHYVNRIDLADAAYGAAEYDRAAEVATRVLREAADFESTWVFGNGVHHGHIVLGRVALARGDVAGACEHLLAAGATRGSPQLDSFGPDFALASDLLAGGESAAVIAYLDACKRFWKGEVRLLDSWQATIRRGARPRFKLKFLVEEA